MNKTEVRLMKLSKRCGLDDCGGWVCEFHALRSSAQEYIEQLEADLELKRAQWDDEWGRRLELEAELAEVILFAKALDLGNDNLKAENERLIQLVLDMDSRFAALTDEERDAFEDALKEGAE